MALMQKLWHGVYGKNFTKPMAFATRGLILAAPASGSGKTIVTLGLLRCLARQGIEISPIKVGPDYIDPVFHEMASGRSCRSLDTWAMRASIVTQGVIDASATGSFVICEGVMGLFDGARGADPKRDGSTASLARETGWPVILVVDAAAQAASAAAVVRGFSSHDPTVPVKGVLFNRVGSASHETILREAMAEALPTIPILGCLPHVASLNLPSRHLGLVQAIEHSGFPELLERAADWIETNVDLEMLITLASVKGETGTSLGEIDMFPLIGDRIAVARDSAFSFVYPHVLESWQRAGACIDFFSPLADQGPDPGADAVYLPGGYPELHAGRIAANSVFHGLMSSARERGAAIFGECGGYMVLGEELTSEDGNIHSMLGFLPLQTSFAKRELNIGYRMVRMLTKSLLGKEGMVFRGHEFHYATIARERGGQPLFQASNAAGEDMGEMGLVAGRVAGSFVHLIDRSS